MYKYLLILIKPFAAIFLWTLRKYQKHHNYIPEWYFFNLERTVPMTPYELFVVKQTERGEEIFLIKRPADDPAWPGAWHFPGTIQRYHDDLPTIFDRLAKELNIDKLPSEPKLVGIDVFKNVRGRHTHIFHRIDVPADASFSTGQFFPIKTLPKGSIEYQVRNIKELIIHG